MTETALITLLINKLVRDFQVSAEEVCLALEAMLTRKIEERREERALAESSKQLSFDL